MLSSALESIIIREGNLQLAAIQEQIEREPHLYMEVILRLFSTFGDAVKRFFSNDIQLSRARDQGCKMFINSNIVCETGEKSAELLAKYCHLILRTGAVSKTLTEDQLDDMLSVLV